MDRAQVHIDGLEGAEVAFHAGQRLVGGHDLGRSHLLGIDGGADEVQPVQGRLGGDGLGGASAAEGVRRDVQGKCLAILYAPMTLPTRIPILPAPARRPAFTAATILVSLVSVDSSSARRLRARCVARAGLRQAIRGSPADSCLGVPDPSSGTVVGVGLVLNKPVHGGPRPSRTTTKETKTETSLSVVPTRAAPPGVQSLQSHAPVDAPQHAFTSIAAARQSTPVLWWRQGLAVEDRDPDQVASSSYGVGLSGSWRLNDEGALKPPGWTTPGWPSSDPSSRRASRTIRRGSY